MNTTKVLVSACVVALWLAAQASAKAESGSGGPATPTSPTAADLETGEGVAKWVPFVTKAIGFLEERVAQANFPTAAKDAAQKLLTDLNTLKADLAAIPANAAPSV